MTDMTVYDEIRAERDRQDAEWGQEHDDGHSGYDWEYLVARYGDSLATRARVGGDMAAWRRRMLQAATLAVAAVEWHDRARRALAEQPAPGDGEGVRGGA